ncbi:MAG: hypothetical protein RLZZ232_2242 [Planctomycetota bacterium]|jgi:hypothetical protein
MNQRGNRAARVERRGIRLIAALHLTSPVGLMIIAELLVLFSGNSQWKP